MLRMQEGLLVSPPAAFTGSLQRARPSPSLCSQAPWEHLQCLPPQAHGEACGKKDRAQPELDRSMTVLAGHSDQDWGWGLGEARKGQAVLS